MTPAGEAETDGARVACGFQRGQESRGRAACGDTAALRHKPRPLHALPVLAFDHARIIAAARACLIDRIDQSPLALALLPQRFTLTRLQKVCEAVAGRTIDKRNFRRSILGRGWIAEAGEMERGRFRPAMPYEAAAP